MATEFASQLLGLLSALSSTDNEVRSTAETQLDDGLEKQPAELLSGLSHLVRVGADSEVRSTAAIILRRFGSRSPPNAPAEDDITYWIWIPTEAIEFCQGELIASLLGESDSATRRKICDTVSELARALSPKQGWPGLLATVFQCSQSPVAGLREATYRIIAAVPELVSSQDPAQVKGALAAALNDADLQVKLTALNASVQYLSDVDADVRNQAADLVPLMVNFLPPLATSENEEQLAEALGYLVELAEMAPKLFRPIIGQIVQFVAVLMADENLCDNARQMAFELVLTLSETASAMMRKQPNFVTTVVPLAMNWLAQIEDDGEWDAADDIDDDDNESNAVVAEQGLDRIARYIGGKTVLPTAFGLIPTFLGSPEWQKRHAALMTISAIGEGCHKIMQAELDNILKLVVQFVRDPHPRVRYAACHAMGQMSTDFASKIQNQFHKVIVPALIHAMDDVEHPRVQAHAAAAIVNFAEDAQKKDLAPYLDVLFQKLMTLLGTGKTYVQEQAITTLATVADSCSDLFGKHYASVMPMLVNIMNEATAKEFKMLRGKTIECSSLVALAVGRDVFGPDSQMFCNLLLNIQKDVTDPDDPQASYLSAAWARLCKVMGADFVPYLPTVMPALLKSAQLKPDLAVLDKDDDDTAQYSEEDGWEFVQFEGQNIGIRTTVLEEKCNAVEMLAIFAKELGAGFQEYVEQVTAIALPLLKFYFHEGVRHAAASLLPLLLKCAKDSNCGYPYLIAMWTQCGTKMIETIAGEPDLQFLGQLYASITESLEVMEVPCLTECLMQDFAKNSSGQMKDYLVRLAERDAARKDADYDAEEEEALAEVEDDEDTFMSEFSKSIHEIFKTHSTAFLPSFDLLVADIDTFMNSTNTSARQLAICIYDDLIEYCGAQAWLYHERFLERMVRSLGDSSSDVRQAAAYGLGLAGALGGEQFAGACAQAIPLLFAIANHPDARTEDNVLASENAVSAIGKICHFNSSQFDVNQVLTAWVEALPILEDEEEMNGHTYVFLCDLIDSRHDAVMAGNTNIPRLTRILCEVLGRGADFLSADIKGRCLQSIHGLAALDKGILSLIPPEVQAMLAG